jgi:hypothetical protein
LFGRHVEDDTQENQKLEETGYTMPNTTPDQVTELNLVLMYYELFFDCKKSHMFTRYAGMGKCAYLDWFGDYYMSDGLKYMLKQEISAKIYWLIQSAASPDTPPTMFDRIYRFLLRHKNYIIQKAIKYFYVITYKDRQTFVDIKKNDNKIPKDTRDRVVFPAHLYLTDDDREELKHKYDEAVLGLEKERQEEYSV